MIRKIVITLLMMLLFSMVAEAQSKTKRSINYNRYNKTRYYNTRNSLVHRRYQKASKRYFFKYTMSKAWHNTRRYSSSKYYRPSSSRYYKRRK